MATSLGCLHEAGCSSGRIPVLDKRPGTDVLVSLHSTPHGLDEDAHLTHATWAS